MISFGKYFELLTENKINSHAVIMRGPSGYGKSTAANKLKDYLLPHMSVEIVSTDNFWGPNYDFDPTRIVEAHAWCLEQFKKSKAKVVIVDNTNLKYEYMKPYIKHAHTVGRNVHYCEPTVYDRVPRDLAKNIHSVPDDIVGNMVAMHEPQWKVLGDLILDMSGIEHEV